MHLQIDRDDWGGEDEIAYGWHEGRLYRRVLTYPQGEEWGVAPVASVSELPEGSTSSDWRRIYDWEDCEAPVEQVRGYARDVMIDARRRASRASTLLDGAHSIEDHIGFTLRVMARDSDEEAAAIRRVREVLSWRPVAVDWTGERVVEDGDILREIRVESRSDPASD